MNKLFFKYGSCIFSILTAFTLAGFFFAGCSEPLKEPSAKMIVLIGIDGLCISGFQEAETPNLDELVRNGALSLKTRPVLPSISAPNWVSYLTGTSPEHHGVTFNGWTQMNSLIRPSETDPDGFFPSVFQVLAHQRPGAKTGMFYDWNDLGDLFNPSYIHHSEYSGDWASSLKNAARWIGENSPDFTFVYIGHPAEARYENRYNEKKYLQAIEEVDAALGELFSGLKKAELFDRIHFLVASGSGRRGYGHGEGSIEEIEVPWIISGPGIIRNRMIGQPASVFNTAPTIVRLFGLENPEAWIGKAVRGAFEGSAEAAENMTSYVPQPISSLKSGIYTVSDTLSFSVKTEGLTIRFTLNGEEPDLNSTVYKNPILLLRNSVVKAAAFMDEHRSSVTTVNYTIVKAFRSIELAYKPHPEYAGKGAFTLADQKSGSYDHRDGRWLGFEGLDLHAKIMLDEMTDVSSVMIGYMNNPDAWIFAPENISVMGSVDGNHFVSLGGIGEDQINAQNRKGRNQLMIPIQPSKLRYLRVYVANTGVCPRGHPGEGEPAWLFVDEILVQ
jgi:hypothetical protein